MEKADFSAVGGVDFLTGYMKAREARQRIEAELCPTCAMDKNLDCLYRGREGCKLEQPLHELEQKERHRRKMLNAGIPLEFHDNLLGQVGKEIQQTPAMQAVLELHQSIPLGADLLILGGRSGRGKSFAASWVVGMHGGYFVNSSRLASYERRDPDEGSTDPLWLWLKCKALAIDDLGQEHSPSGFATSVLNEIIRERCHNRRVTVITTKLPPTCANGTCKTCLSCRYGENLISRAWGTGLGYRVATGPDLRNLEVRDA